jgi:hypothetical protein
VSGLWRRRYRVVLRAVGLQIPVEDSPLPITGFTAVRLVRALDEREAKAAALSRLRSEWFGGPFAAVDRAGGPAFSILSVERIRNPFHRPRQSRGYEFIHETGGGDEGDGGTGAP